MAVKGSQFIAFASTIFSSAFALPPHFVYLKSVAPTVIQDIRYYSENNFVGHPIKGYKAPECIVTKEAGAALQKLQRKLNNHYMGIKVYDCYRPERAVNEFLVWSQNIADQAMKNQYYPHVNKADVFRLGYVSSRSSHMRGSTVDLTLVKFKNGKAEEINMGTPFDYLDPSSHTLSASVSQEATQNRLYLRQLMAQAGFKPISTEWWHFTLINEPYKKGAFDFIVR